MNLDLDPGPTPAGPNRAVAIALALVAAACLVTASFSRRWLASPLRGTDIGFGLREFSACIPAYGGAPARCEARGNGEVVAEIRREFPGQASGAFAPTGWITFASNLVAALALAAAAALAALGKRPALPVAVTTVALLGLLTSLIVGCVFVATKPGGAQGVGVAWAFWVFAVGDVVGVAAAQLLAKLLRPADPDLTAGAMHPDQF